MPAAPLQCCVHSLPGRSRLQLPGSSPVSTTLGFPAVIAAAERLHLPEAPPPCTGPLGPEWKGSGKEKNLLGKDSLPHLFQCRIVVFEL